MEISSEYSFPIFISSTDYNLTDLRAELASHLHELGYRPILSSFEGFPDSSPDLEPWESCLRVLDYCFAMVLIIDDRYGKAVEWPHFTDFLNRKLSPTHAEYIYAHTQGKRMFVFIRDHIMTYFQSYLMVMQQTNGNVEVARGLLTKTLPQNVEFETMQFIEEVKTKKPIPWIKTYTDVTVIKKELQKKLLNDLAEIFLIKNKHLETVVRAFSKLMDEMSSEKRKGILQSVGATRELIEAFELKSKEAQELREREEGLKIKLEKTREELEVTRADVEKGKKTEKDLKALKARFAEFEEQRRVLEKNIVEKERSFVYGKTFTLSATPGPTEVYGLHPDAFSHHGLIGALNRCDKCGQEVGLSSLSMSLRTCPRCARKLCGTCWPGVMTAVRIDMCPECAAKIPLGSLG